jgi:D-alanine-D-alanine ligase
MDVVLIRSLADKPWRSAATYDLIEAGLREQWPDTRSVTARDPEELREGLAVDGSRPNDLLVFNIAEYIDEKRKRGFIPGLLESWGLAHLGSPAATIEIGLDKGRTQELLRKRRVPVAPSFAAAPGAPDLRKRARAIGYPLFVKPLREGGHLGISEDAIVRDDDALERAISRNADRFGQPSLVERYLDGPGMREFSVGVIGNRRRLFTPVEIDWDAMPLGTRILSYEAAHQDLERVNPVGDPATVALLGHLASRTFDAIGALDYARVDLRMVDGVCYVLEINLMPGLGPHSFLPGAARDIHGLEYGALVRRLAEEAMHRVGMHAGPASSPARLGSRRRSARTGRTPR